MFRAVQSFSKIYLLKTTKDKSLRELKYGGTKGLALMSDRTFLNLVEQALPLMVSVWMYGLFVDAAKAATLIYWYMVFRALYPIVFKYGPPLLFLSTVPGYCIIFYAFAGAMRALK